MSSNAQSYNIGVMKIAVTDDPTFDTMVDTAVEALITQLTKHRVQLTTKLFEFAGPHLVPTEGVYAPLDFLQIGLTEKLERQFHFLLIITDVDLSATVSSYVLALPSQLTNIGIISTRRLAPSFWGLDGGDEAAIRRLVGLSLHTLGHLLNVPHQPDSTNVMYDFQSVTDLDHMADITDPQLVFMRQQLPREARSHVAKTSEISTLAAWIIHNRATIWRAIRRANPFRLAAKLPTMVTAGFSLISVLFFTAEIWDVTNALAPGVLVVFSLIALVGATMALHTTFASRAGSMRNKTIVEAAVVTEAATVICLLLTIMVLYAAFGLLGYVGASTFFPRGLMTTWSSLDPAVDVIDHVKLAMFLGAMGVLGGSLGGRADRRDLIRNVLFIDEES